MLSPGGAGHNPIVDINALKRQVDAEIATRMAREADSVNYIQRRVLRTHGMALLVELDVTSEVLKTPTLYRLPGAPNGVIGLANRHGRVVPVVDISLLFPSAEKSWHRSGASGNNIDSDNMDSDEVAETKQAPSPGYWLVVAGRGDAAVGLVIDELPDRLRIAKADEVPLSSVPHPIAEYAKAAYRTDGSLRVGLDTEKLFAMVFNIT